MTLETQVPRVPVALSVPWRWRKLIFLGTMTCLVTAAAGTLFLPKTFQAQATLMLTSQVAPNSPGAGSFSIETLRNLLLADSVIAELRNRLLVSGSQADTLTVGGLRRKLDVSAYLAKESARPGESKYLPILTLEARARSASQAAAIVNAWAEVVLAPDVNPIYLDRNRFAKWVSADYSKALEDLDKLETEILERSEDSRMSQLSMERKWSERLTAHAEATATSIAGHRSHTEQLLSQHRAETEKMRLEFQEIHQLERKRRELETLDGRLVDLGQELGRTAGQLASLSGKVTRLEEEIRLQPNTLVLPKAISNDSLWNRVLGQAPEELKRDLSHEKLLNEYPNPVYETLVQTRANDRIAQHRLLASKTYLAEELERARHQIAELDGQVVESQIQLVQLLADREVALKRIQFDREAGLEQVVNGRKAEYHVLQLTHQEQVETLDQRMQHEKAGLERQNKIAAGTLAELSKRLARHKSWQPLATSRLLLSPRNPTNL